MLVWCYLWDERPEAFSFLQYAGVYGHLVITGFPFYTVMNLTASITLAVSAFLSGSTLPSSNIVAIQPFQTAQTVEEYVREYFADVPVMVAIAKCESQFRQFDEDGNILKNPTSTAIGVFQIMASIHQDHADEALGLDITNVQGNAAYARYLYEQQGTVPWNASKACWGKTQAAKDHFAKK